MRTVRREVRADRDRTLGRWPLPMAATVAVAVVVAVAVAVGPKTAEVEVGSAASLIGLRGHRFDRRQRIIPNLGRSTKERVSLACLGLSLNAYAHTLAYAQASASATYRVL